MKWGLSLPESQTLVYYYVKLIGLAPFTLKKNKFHPPTLLNVLYAVSFAIAYLIVVPIVFTDVLKKFNRPNDSPLSNIGGFIQYFVSFASTLSTLLISLFMCKSILHIMNKLRTIGNELRNLGINEDLKKFFRNLITTTVMSNAVLLTACTALSIMDHNWSIGLSIEYSIDTWFHFNTVSIFAEILLFIKQRFKLLNGKLYDVFRPAVHLVFLRELPMRRNHLKENREGIEDLTDRQRILKIEELHLELTELLYQTTEIFAIPILLNSLEFCIEIMLSCFRMYVVIRDSTGIRSGAEFVSMAICVTSPLLRMVIAMVSVFIIAQASEKIYEEGIATKTVLFGISYKFKPRKLEDEFCMFTLQMLHKPVAVSIFGFFDLGYSLLYTMSCAAMAYVIIMIQFDTPQPNPGI